MYKYLLYFLIFSFLGWCAEAVFRFVKCHRPVNPGLAGGPFCPIYGIGICLCAVLLGGVRSFLLLSVLSMAIATAVELAVGLFCDRLLSLRLWDYTSEKGNILGYVCPRFSVIWGFLCASVIKLLSLVDRLISVLDGALLKGAAFMILVLVLVDERMAIEKPRKNRSREFKAR